MLFHLRSADTVREDLLEDVGENTLAEFPDSTWLFKLYP
jgi:hypothetical protein